MSRRTSRVNDLLREELSALILREVKDPRVSRGLVSITEVDVSPDLHNATVYVSHLGSEKERDDVLLGLNHSAAFMQKELKHRLAMRAVPSLTFRFDPSIERGARLTSLIHQVSAGAAPESDEPAE